MRSIQTATLVAEKPNYCNVHSPRGPARRPAGRLDDPLRAASAPPRPPQNTSGARSRQAPGPLRRRRIGRHCCSPGPSSGGGGGRGRPVARHAATAAARSLKTSTACWTRRRPERLRPRKPRPPQRCALLAPELRTRQFFFVFHMSNECVLYKRLPS